jgi:hypothetical protein
VRQQHAQVEGAEEEPLAVCGAGGGGGGGMDVAERGPLERARPEQPGNQGGSCRAAMRAPGILQPCILVHTRAHARPQHSTAQNQTSV